MDWTANGMEWILFFVIPFSLFPPLGALACLLGTMGYMVPMDFFPQTKQNAMIELQMFWCIVLLSFPSTYRLLVIFGIVCTWSKILTWNLFLKNIAYVTKIGCLHCKVLMVWMWLFDVDNYVIIGLLSVYLYFGTSYDPKHSNQRVFIPFQRLTYPFLQPNVYNQLQSYVVSKLLEFVISSEKNQLQRLRLCLLLMQGPIYQKKRKRLEPRKAKKFPIWFLCLGFFLQCVFLSGYNVNKKFHQCFLTFQTCHMVTCLVTYPQLKFVNEIVNWFQTWDQKRPGWEENLALWNGDVLFDFARGNALFIQVKMLEIRINQYNQIFLETKTHLPFVYDVLILVIDYSFGSCDSNLPIVDFAFCNWIKAIDKPKQML
jgi:hypothetical protein